MSSTSTNDANGSPLRQLMIREMQLQRLSKHTIRSYLMSVNGLAVYYNRSPCQLTTEEVRSYIHYLITNRKLATSTVNVRIAAFRFLYRQVLRRDEFDLRARAKRSGRLPEPLSRQEVTRLLEAAENRKHRMMLMTAYSAGLRVSELIELQVTDIHSDRMLIHIRHAKGDKDRFTLLSKKLLFELRQYWVWCRPETHLFQNRDGNKMSTDSAQRVFYRAKEKAGIAVGCVILSL